MANKGDKLTDFVTSDWYNKVSKYLKPNTGLIGPGTLATQNQYITVHNHSTTPRERWEAVSIGGPVIDYELPLDDGVHFDFHFHTTDLSSSDPHNLAILQEPLAEEEGSTAIALLWGLSWLILPEETDIDTELTRLQVGSGNTLEYSHIGRVEEIKFFTLEDIYLSLVMIGHVSSTPDIELRIDGLNYQISYDGGDTWENWAGGGLCSS